MTKREEKLAIIELHLRKYASYPWEHHKSRERAELCLAELDAIDNDIGTRVLEGTAPHHKG
jgi:hypothetical protein